MSSKRLFSGNTASGSKRGHFTLSIQDKVELLKKLDSGTSVKKLCEFYGVGSSTVYDIKKQKEKILHFYANTDSVKEMGNRKTIREGKSKELDSALITWFRLRRSEGVSISGQMVQEQAKIFHEELKLDFNCDYSQGWLQKFKKRHGISVFTVSGEKLSADKEAADNFIDYFSKLIKENNLTPDQIYNCDETALFWRCMPKKTLGTEDEDHAGAKESKERVTVLGCSNAAGTHRLKLLVIGKSRNPRAFKNIKVFPVIYRAQKRGWMMIDIMREWFENHFIPKAREHCNSCGLQPHCKIMLIMDNCAAHPSAERMQKENAFVQFLPPNCTSLIQPLDQGILRSLKCRYRSEYMQNFLSGLNKGKKIDDVKKDFTLKDALWAVARAWNDIPNSILTNAWHKLWPASVFIDDDNVDEDFQGFHVSKEKEVVEQLLKYAKSCIDPAYRVESEEIEKWLHVDDAEPIAQYVTDSDIVKMVEKKSDIDSESSESEDEPPIPKISIDDCLHHAEQLITGMQQYSCFTDTDLMNIFAVKNKLIRERPNVIKQKKITDIFKKLN